MIDPETQNNINKTVYFPGKGQNRIVMTYDNSFNAFFTFAHEFGHSYYNKFYRSDNYFDVTNRTVNETLAIYFEFSTVLSLLQSDIDADLKKNIGTQFVERTSKLLISNYSIHYLEKRVINHLNKFDQLSLEDFLRTQKEVDEELFKSIVLKNAENNYLSILLYPYFVFYLHDYIVDPIAVLLASYLHEHYKEDSLLFQFKVKEFLTGDDLSVSKFCKMMFNHVLDGELVETMIKSFIETSKNIIERVN